MEANLVGPCGMNCAVCMRYLATSKAVAKKLSMAQCRGCGPQGKRCAFLKQCVPLGEKRISFCYECSDFPCRRLKTLDRRYVARYQTSLIENLLAIKELGMAPWLEQEAARWRCPHCGGTVSIHDRTCYDCGRGASQAP